MRFNHRHDPSPYGRGSASAPLCKGNEMQWSKLKNNVESFFAESVRGRAELRSTRYHKSHDREGRGYITIDKIEVASFCSITAWNKEYQLATELRNISGATDFRNPDQKKEYYASYDQAEEILNKQGILTQYSYYDALTEYLSMSIDEALSSDHFVIKSIAILDRRLGRRRIPQLKETYTSHPALKRLFEFRCSVENISC